MTHAANPAGMARISIESKHGAICENRVGRPINGPLRRCHCHQPPFRPSDGPRLLARVNLADNNFETSIGMSGSMTPSPRQGVLRRGRLVQTPTLAQAQGVPLSPGERHRDGPGDRLFSEPSNPRRPNLHVTDSSWAGGAMKHFKFDVSVSAKKQRVNLFGTD